MSDPLGLDGFQESSRLGAGGFSTVWQTYQTKFDRWVAVKVLTVGELDKATLRRFEREAAAMGRLSDHPNVVTVYDASVAPDGRPYIVAELCPGGSYADRVKQVGALSISEVLTVAGKLASALSEAHAADIVHRDIKPANVFITRRGEPALGDFGLSVRPLVDSSRGLNAMSIVHAPPETIEAGIAGTAGDLYSLGSTLYTLLAGRPPYPQRSGETDLAYTNRRLHEDVPALERPDVPAALAALVMQLLKRDPSSRPGSAAAVLAAVTAIAPPVVGSEPWRAEGDLLDEPPTTAGAEQRPRDDLYLDEPPTTATPPTSTPGPPIPQNEAADPPGPSRRKIAVGLLVATALAAGVGAAIAVVGDGSATKKDSGPAITLAAPVESGGAAALSWQGPAGLQYALDIAPTGAAAKRTVVGTATTYRVPVAAGTPYCFQVRGTDGTTVLVSNTVSLGGAECDVTAKATTAAVAKTVVVSKGKSARAAGCTAAACAQLTVRLSGFAASAAVQVACKDPGGTFFSYSVTTDASGAATSSTCVYGFAGKQVSADAGGVTSNLLTW